MNPLHVTPRFPSSSDTQGLWQIRPSTWAPTTEPSPQIDDKLVDEANHRYEDYVDASDLANAAPVLHDDDGTVTLTEAFVDGPNAHEVYQRRIARAQVLKDHLLLLLADHRDLAKLPEFADFANELSDFDREKAETRARHIEESTRKAEELPEPARTLEIDRIKNDLETLDQRLEGEGRPSLQSAYYREVFPASQEADPSFGSHEANRQGLII